MQSITNDISIFPHQCLRRRLNSYSCTACIESCKNLAIKLVDGDVQLDKSSCTECGRCVAVCPGEAFKYSRSNIYHDIKSKESGTILVCCYQQIVGAPEEVAVPCLGILSPEVLIFLGASNFSSVFLNTKECATCHNHHAYDAVITLTDQLMSDFSKHFMAEIVFQDKASNTLDVTSEGRRSFLHALGREAVTFLEKYSNLQQRQKGHPIKAGKRLPEKRLILGMIPQSITNKLSNQLWPQMSLTGDCTYCPRCSGICPTGALKIKPSNTTKTLSFTPPICSECGLCEEFCKQQAISIRKVLAKYY